jgi:type II secretory pathway pseudopilin PulG
MTIVGKILVFVNLLFSLAVAALVIFVYVARTNYARELENAKQVIQVTQASAQTFHQEAEKARNDQEVEHVKMTAQLKEEQKKNGELRVQVQDYEKKLAEEKQKTQRFNATMERAQGDVSLGQENVKKIRALLEAETDRNNKLVLENNKMREEKVQAEIERNAVKDRNVQLETQVRQLAKDMERLKANGGTATVRGTKNPPAENVEGLIKTIESGLVKITIGSDAGLVKGHTLEAFRLGSVPSQSRYLGTLRVLEVTPHEAVCQPVGRMAAPLQVGDVVASKILGG